MYLSLKGSLGHTPITDRVGEGPLQIAEGAAAAYSLRNLGSDSPSVVRVRRESDNNERDFTAQDISTSVLTNWVNQQITPPLDLRELTATGRDGPIIEAAAAYSLRNLSDSYTGSVVEVRRSSDSAVRSFTAAEVTDGTLVAWVSEAPIAQNSTSNPYTTFTNDSNTGFTATLSSGIAFAGFGNVEGSSGDSVTVSFDLNIVSGSPRLALRASSSSISDVSNGVSYTSSGSYSLTMTATGNFAFIGFSEGDIPSEFTVSNFEITSVSGATYVRDGTVSKWYDQSTTSGVPNAKHAVQTSTASQPKIVDGGSLVTGGLTFDGVNDHFTCPSLYSANLSVFTKVTTDNTNSDNFMRLLHICDGSDSFQITRGGGADIGNFLSKNTSFQALTAGFNHGSISGNSLLTSITSGSATESYANGSLRSNGSATIGDGGNTTTTIGARTDLLSSTFFNNAIAEIIIYPSDQTDNRTALEANIGEVYGIAGIPAYDNTVNGFVETWYDQSGNGNNATQLTAGDQPRIVISGNLVTSSNGLPAIRVNAQAESFDLDSNISLGNFSSFYVVEHNAFGSAVSWLSDSNGADYFRYTPTSYNVDAGGVDNGFINLDATLATATDYLISAMRGSGTIELSVSGSVQSNTDSNSGTLDVKKIFQRGNNQTQGLNGYAQELIIYPTDETANRPAIEANINNQYDIY